MHIFKKVSSSILISIASVNFALADIVPVTCPLPKDIQNPPPESKEHSVPKIKCIGDNCVWEQTNRFGTDLHWHFYIHSIANSTKDQMALNTQMHEVISSLTYANGPIEEQPYAFVCRYRNKLNFNALAVYTKEIKCPSANDLIEQKAKGQTQCDWLTHCTYTLEDRFDSDFTWSFRMNLNAFTGSSAQDTVYSILPNLTPTTDYDNVTSYPIKRDNLYICRYHTSADEYKAEATYLTTING
ncbi:MAG: hypothetical protein V4501_09475 [Pseudomonadota bacterium]